jgi:hypothetical protein
MLMFFFIIRTKGGSFSKMLYGFVSGDYATVTTGKLLLSKLITGKFIYFCLSFGFSSSSSGCFFTFLIPPDADMHNSFLNLSSIYFLRSIDSMNSAGSIFLFKCFFVFFLLIFAF